MSKRKRPRAVGYCRTSSESQRDNTSIPIQKDVITQACELNNWELLKFYVDESKSAKQIAGRDAFQQLMRDAGQGEFDKVVSLDVKRFGRNGLDILQSANTLKREFGVDYVEAKGGFDTKPGSSQVMVNYVQAGAAEHERLLILERTSRGRREKTRMTGAPAWGNSWPHGRNWTGQKWELDQEKQTTIAEAAQRYLAGERIRDLAEEYRMDYTSLHAILRDKCGDTITVHFNAVPDLELAAEDINVPVPRLLPQRTITRIQRKMEANRTKPRGHRNNDFLFSGVVFCGQCQKRALTPQTTNNVRYYRPQGCSCFKGQVNAKQLEDAVMEYLFEMFGNPAKVQQAIDRAIPNKKKVAQLEKQRAKLTKDLDQNKKRVERLVNAIEDGAISGDDARSSRLKLREKETKVQAELDQINNELAYVPATRGRFSSAKLRASTRSFEQMTTSDKRELITMLFGDTLPDGRRTGVYVQSIKGKENKRPRPWKFWVLGKLVDDTEAVDVKGRTDREPYFPGQVRKVSDVVNLLASL